MVVRNPYPSVPYCFRNRSPRRLRPRRQIMPDQRRLEPARARIVDSGLNISARLRDRFLGIGGDLDQIVAEEAAALMRPKSRIQAVACEKTAMIALFHDAPAVEHDQPVH